MLRLLMSFFLLSLIGGPLPSAAKHCVCQKIKTKGGWCGICQVGYIASVKVESADLFEALDAHGHRINPKSIECKTCLAAIESNGYCEFCVSGYVNKLAYYSRLTYHIALGEIKEPNTITCKSCKLNMDKGGWCSSCNLGMIGNVAIRDEDQFGHAVKAFELLHKAIDKLDDCELCAAAMITGGKCPKCTRSRPDKK